MGKGPLVVGETWAAVTEKHLLMRGGGELGTNGQHCSKKVSRATIPLRHMVPFSPVLSASAGGHTGTGNRQGDTEVSAWAGNFTGPHMGSLLVTRRASPPAAPLAAVAALFLNPLPLAKHFLLRGMLTLCV